jgi:hypothetical protein
MEFNESTKKDTNNKDGDSKKKSLTKDEQIAFRKKIQLLRPTLMSHHRIFEEIVKEDYQTNVQPDGWMDVFQTTEGVQGTFDFGKWENIMHHAIYDQFESEYKEQQDGSQNDKNKTDFKDYMASRKQEVFDLYKNHNKIDERLTTLNGWFSKGKHFVENELRYWCLKTLMADLDPEGMIALIRKPYAQ